MPKNKWKITIITPTYNAEDSIESTIKSVINQDYDNIEIIVIDGQSTDKTMHIVEKYKDKITKYISEPDSGIYEAMNKGLHLATGEYINFMCAGDSFTHHHVISDLLKSINIHRIEGVYYGDTSVITDGDTWVKKSDPTLLRDTMSINHQSCFINTKLHRKYPYNETFKIVADYEVLRKLYLDGIEFVNLNQTVANFDNKGISTKKQLHLWAELLGILACNNESENLLLETTVTRKIVNRFTKHHYNTSIKDIESIIQAKDQLQRLKNTSFIRHPFKKYKLYKKFISHI